jgi:ornithine cyclodeaminase/alanine dehydrogenase-like protein (mu-crystallin family)
MAAVDVALIGAGVQGHSHLPVLGHVLPGARLRLFDRDPQRAEQLAAAARGTAGISGVTVHRTAREAVDGAAVVVTAASFGPAEERQSLTNAWLRPDTTVVPIDYATYVAASVAHEAALFLVDDRGQYLANRDAGNFDGYPEPSATIGEAILAGTRRPAGRVVISHLGVGLADLVFADAIVRSAIARGLGMTLTR